MTPRRQLLTDAADLVDGSRNRQYGPPVEDFGRTAAMWTAYLGHHIDPHQVGIMLALVKVSRSTESPDERDHYVDAAGYFACAWDCVLDDTYTVMDLGNEDLPGMWEASDLVGGATEDDIAANLAAARERAAVCHDDGHDWDLSQMVANKWYCHRCGLYRERGQ